VRVATVRLEKFFQILSIYMTKICENKKIISKVETEVETRGQSNLTKSVSRGADSPVRSHPRGSKVVPLNSWGRVSY